MAHQAELIVHVVQVAAHPGGVLALDLRADDQHGGGVRVRLADRGADIRQAGAGDDDRHARLAGGARVAVRHEARALLVPGEDVPDAARVQRVVDVQCMDARNAEDRIDAVRLQCRDDRRPTLHACSHAFHLLHIAGEITAMAQYSISGQRAVTRGTWA